MEGPSLGLDLAVLVFTLYLCVHNCACFSLPREYKSSNGLLEVTLTVTTGEIQEPVHFITRTYDGSLPGPTLRVTPGDTLRILLVNSLTGPPNNGSYIMTHAPSLLSQYQYHGVNTTNLHVHGLHVAAQSNADNTGVVVPPGGSWQYEYKLPSNHPSGTFFYHPHYHGSTAFQLMSGMAGMIIVEEQLPLPAIAAMSEIPLVLQTLRFETGCPGCSSKYDYMSLSATMGNKLPLPSIPKPTTYYLLNGQFQPTISLTEGLYTRLRILNADATAFARLVVVDEECDMYILAYDGYYAESPREADHVLLPPGGRRDVAIKCSSKGKYTLAYHAPQDNATIGSTLPFTNGPVSIATLSVESRSQPTGGNAVVEAAAFLPSLLPAPQLIGTLPDLRGMSGTTPVDKLSVGFNKCSTPAPTGLAAGHCINGLTFDMARIDFTTHLDTVNEWTVTGLEIDINHPFHMHQNPVQVIDFGGAPIADINLIGQYVDVVPVPVGGWIRVRFVPTDFSGVVVYHCHVLQHEDTGMMANLALLPAPAGAQPYSWSPRILLSELIKQQDIIAAAVKRQQAVETSKPEQLSGLSVLDIGVLFAGLVFAVVAVVTKRTVLNSYLQGYRPVGGTTIELGI